jgi:hypothetical protein
VIETQQPRQLAKNLMELLDAPAIRDTAQDRTFLDDQKETLQKTRTASGARERGPIGLAADDFMPA